jgi:hypothetical protein
MALRMNLDQDGPRETKGFEYLSPALRVARRSWTRSSRTAGAYRLWTGIPFGLLDDWLSAQLRGGSC